MELKPFKAVSGKAKGRVLTAVKGDASKTLMFLSVASLLAELTTVHGYLVRDEHGLDVVTLSLTHGVAVIVT